MPWQHDIHQRLPWQAIRDLRRCQNESTCSHRKSYDVDILKKIVIDNFRDRLVDPKVHAEAVRAAHERYAELEMLNSAERIAAEKQINRLTVQINRIVDAIENTDQPVKPLVASLQAKEAERVGLVERVRLLGASNVISLHPSVVDRYREAVEELHAGLRGDVIAPKVVMAFRNVMDSIVVTPTGYRKPYEIDVYGRLAAMMGGVELFPAMRSAKEIIAAEGVSRGGNPANNGGQVQYGNTRR